MILNLSDVTWMLKSFKQEHNFVFMFKSIKSRHLYVNQAFELDFNTNTLKVIDFDEAGRSNVQTRLIEEILQALKDYPDGIQQSKLLKTIGRSRDDKTARNTISQYNGKLWITTIMRNGKFIKLKNLLE